MNEFLNSDDFVNHGANSPLNQSSRGRDQNMFAVELCVHGNVCSQIYLSLFLILSIKSFLSFNILKMCERIFEYRDTISISLGHIKTGFTRIFH